MSTKAKPREFVDADVLFAGAASPSEHGASPVVLRVAEITLLTAGVSQQVVAEATRNLAGCLPRVLPVFETLMSRCVQVIPAPSSAELEMVRDMADPKDAPILAAAVRESCAWLVTFNVRHYGPGHPAVTVLRPGQFLQQVRSQLAHLS